MKIIKKPKKKNWKNQNQSKNQGDLIFLIKRLEVRLVKSVLNDSVGEGKEWEIMRFRIIHEMCVKHLQFS